MPLDMYAEQILEHYKNPRNKHALENAQVRHRENNPLCGDVLEFFLRLDAHGRVESASFQGDGCAISQASASLLTEELKGKSLQEVAALKKEDVLDLLGIPVSPTRLKCALLALSTVQAGVKEFKGKAIKQA